MKRTCITAIAMALAAGACGGSGKPAAVPTTPPPSVLPTVSPTPPVQTPKTAKVVYAAYHTDVAKTPRDLYLWDAATDTLKRLTTDGQKTVEQYPRFAGDEITYTVEGKLMSMPASGGPPVKLAETPGQIMSVDWNGDASIGVILSVDWSKPQDTVWIYTASTKRLKVLRRFPNPCGREGGPEDDFSVWWSADETKILLVETCLEPSVRILQADGTDATTMAGETIAPFWGTFARWSCDGTEVYYKEYEHNATGRWHSLNLRTGSTSPLEIREKTLDLEVSPDGCRLAYISGGEEPVLYVFDVTASTERRLGAGYAAPLWISGSELVAPKVGACGDVETCGETFYEIKGNGAKFNAETGAMKEVKLRGTNWIEGFSREADVRWA